jgi:hypothetical protein
MSGTELPPPGRAVVEMSGELDVTAAAAIAAALSAALARTPDVTVDLAPRRPRDALSADLPFWVMRWVV